MKTTLRFFFPAVAALALAAVTSAAPADAPDGAAGKKININQASAAQIALLPRVGAKAAERIVEYRKAHGSFGQAEELMEVKGIGEKLYGELKPFVSLSGPTTLAAKVRAGARSARGSGRGASAKKTASNSVPVGKGR